LLQITGIGKVCCNSIPGHLQRVFFELKTYMVIEIKISCDTPDQLQKHLSAIKTQVKEALKKKSPGTVLISLDDCSGDHEVRIWFSKDGAPGRR
jgi:hypothetical protein